MRDKRRTLPTLVDREESVFGLVDNQFSGGKHVICLRKVFGWELKYQGSLCGFYASSINN